MKVNDTVIGIVLLAFSIFLMLHVSIGWSWVLNTEFSGFPRAVPGKPGPALFPFILSVLFAICSLILIARGIKSNVPWLVWQEWARHFSTRFNWIVVILVVIAYQLFDELIGFLPVAIILLYFLMKILGVRTRLAFISSVCTSLFIHTLFVKFLLVPLPWGILESVAW